VPLCLCEGGERREIGERSNFEVGSASLTRDSAVVLVLPLTEAVSASLCVVCVLCVRVTVAGCVYLCDVCTVFFFLRTYTFSCYFMYRYFCVLTCLL
jgi:hypothetical protein